MPPAGIHLQPDRWIPSFKLSLVFFRSGVDLFFVLSGFLIAGILIDNRQQRSYYRTFFVRRFCRIFPLYYFLVLIFTMAKGVGANGPIFDGPIPLASYITLTQNYFMAHLRTYGAVWLGATWSLAIEEQFYLSFPFLIRHAKAALPWILFAGIAGAPALRIWCYSYFGNDDFGSYVWLPCRLDSLCWGAMLAYILRSPRALRSIHRHRKWIIAGFIVLLAGAVFLDTALARDIGYHSSHWGHSLLAALYAFAILLTVLYAGRSCTGFLRFKPLLGLGKISYGVYLVHGIALISVFSICGRTVALNGLLDAVLVGTALTLTTAVCALSHRWLEQPFLQIGKRFRYA